MSTALEIGIIAAALGWWGALFRVVWNRDIPTPVAIIGLTIGVIGAIGPIVILLWPSETERRLRDPAS